MAASSPDREFRAPGIPASLAPPVELARHLLKGDMARFMAEHLAVGRAARERAIPLAADPVASNAKWQGRSKTAVSRSLRPAVSHHCRRPVRSVVGRP